jgi:cell division protein FtsQ
MLWRSALRKIRKLRLKKLKKLKRIPGITLAICLLALLTYLLGWSTLFAARAVVIDGTQRTQEINTQILASSSTFHLGEPLARVDVHSLSRKISLLDWVEKQSVRRDWLHGQIHIVIQERTPIAQFIDSAGVNQLIDKSGSIFLARATGSYPTITFKENEKALIDVAAAYIQELPADLLDSAQSFTVASVDSIQSVHSGMASGKMLIRWGNNSEMLTKVKVLRALLALPENSKAHVIDLSAPLSPIVK